MRLVALGLLVGALLAHLAPSLPSAYWGAGLFLALPLILNRRPWLRLPAAIVAGLLWAWLQAMLTLYPVLAPSLEGKDLVLDGRIESLVEERAHAIRFVFAPIEAGEGIPSRLRVNWYRTEARPVPGEIWRLTLRLKRPNGFQNPGGFDYEGWLFQQHVGATGYVRTKGVAMRLEAGRCWLDCLRTALRDRLITIAGDQAHFGIILALAIGDRSFIGPDEWEVLLRTGTNHLVAISGLHIGLVGGLLFWLVQRLVARVPRLCVLAAAPRWGAGAGMLAATGYAALAGFSVPTQRALIMLAVVFGAILLAREVKASTGLAAALVAVLVVDPSAVLSAGFWLSFAAVTLLLLAFRGRAERTRRIRGWVRAQYVLAVGLVPFTLFWFQRAALGAPLANLIAVPWVSLTVVPLVLLGALGGSFWPPLGAVLLGLASALLDPLWELLAFMARQDVLIWHRAIPGALAQALAILGALWLLMPRGMPGRVLGMFMLLPLATAVPERPPPGEAEITLLDVGQGLAAVVTTHRHTLLFDAGPRFSPEFDTGRAVVIPFLRDSAIDRVNVFVVSHGDNDHVGGAASVLDLVPVDSVFASAPDSVPRVTATPCRAGQRWVWDGVVFEMLHPLPGYRGSENNGSCVLQVRAGSRAVLFSADIEAEAEWALAHHHGQALASEVLVVPHHGSNTSSTDYFLTAVRPEIGLIASGYRNRFGFPKDEVVERYQSHGTRLFNTADTGALSFRISDQGVGPVQAYREQRRRLWHRPTGL